MNNEYATGADFWRDTAATHGLDEALVIGDNYLKTQLRQELSREENQFCRELFAAMFEAAAGKVDPARLVYPYSVQEANLRSERSVYFANRDRNDECARIIDTTINGSCYKLYHYNFDIAAMVAIYRYGFQRVNAVLAYCFQTHEWDGRYSASNKQWAQGFALPEKAFSGAYLNAHPVLVESFTNHVRKLYSELNAERFDLPGQPESGEIVGGYEITRAIVFDDNTGFALGRHPEAGSVCWKIVMDDGKRDYHLGFYSDNEQAVSNRYIARVAVHMADGGVREINKPPALPKPPPKQQKPPRKKKDKDVGAI